MLKFFQYYGSKADAARYYGEPRRDLVIEPFAGGAGYSVRWDCPNVRLYDIREELVDLWDWLINCAPDEIMQMPDEIEDVDHLLTLPMRWQYLITSWLYVSGDNIKAPSPKAQFGFYHRERHLGKQNVWGRYLKERIVLQKPLIADWEITCMDYRDIPNIEAHWHIDPPYIKQMTKYGKGQTIDFDHLADWCRSRKGAVDVCEEEGATWLPFRPLRTRTNNHNKPYTEMVWRKGAETAQGDMFPVDWECAQ